MDAIEMLRKEADDETRHFFRKVFAWMFAGLLVSGVTAFAASTSEVVMGVIFGTPLFWILFIGELALVFGLARWMQRMSVLQAIAAFLLYAFMTGLTLSVIFLIYTLPSITMVFVIAASMFGFMAVYGFVTDRDLTQWGSLLLMALFGLIVAMLVNLFLNSSTLSIIISIGGVLLFTVLTAYDIQKIKKRNVRGNRDTPEDTKEAILGALELYLDFINLFLHLLRLLGGRK